MGRAGLQNRTKAVDDWVLLRCRVRLVSLSPSSGYVAPWAAIVCAIVGSIACNLATQLKFFIHVEDPLDVFAIHGIGGMVGSLLVGLFAEKEVAKLDGNRDIKGGWVNQHYAQLGYQCAEVFSVAGYAFFVSLVLLFIIDRIPGLHLRMDPEAESQGPDTNQHGEVCYEFLAQLGDDPSPNHPDTDPSNTINGSSPRPSMDGNQFGIYELHAIQSKKVNDAYHFPMHPPMQVNFPPRYPSRNLHLRMRPLRPTMNHLQRPCWTLVLDPNSPQDSR